jgi:hypothetical protein
MTEQKLEQIKEILRTAQFESEDMDYGNIKTIWLNMDTLAQQILDLTEKKEEEETRLTMIKNGCEYPIACYEGFHYFIAEGQRLKKPFEKCSGTHIDFGDSQPVVSPESLLTDEEIDKRYTVKYLNDTLTVKQVYEIRDEQFKRCQQSIRESVYKEIGEWLEGQEIEAFQDATGTDTYYVPVYEIDIAKLKAGQMPGKGA